MEDIFHMAIVPTGFKRDEKLNTDKHLILLIETQKSVPEGSLHISIALVGTEEALKYNGV